MSTNSKNEEECPPQVRRIQSLLDTPLPDWLRNQDVSSLCDAGRMSYEERAGSGTFAPDEQFSDEEHELLRSLNGFVLRQAAIIQRSDDIDPQRIISPEVIVMLGIILRRTFPTHEICTSMVYALARPPWTRSRPLVLGRYRRATILVREHGDAQASPSASENTSCTGQSFEGEDNMSIDNDSDSVEDAKYDDAYYAYVDAHYVEMRVGDDENGMDIDEESGTQSSVPSFWTPQQLLCAADSKPQPPVDLSVTHVDGIPHLMTSALYHCLALGIEGPLVGLSYKKTCPIVVLNIAWLDERVEDGNELPIAHLLPASFDEPTASFDLRDPLEAFRLAIVLSRYRHIASQRQHSEETSTALPWRADLCARDGLEDNTQGAHAEYVKEASIVEWAEQVYKSTVACELENDMDKKQAPRQSPRLQNTGTKDAQKDEKKPKLKAEEKARSQASTEDEPQSAPPAQSKKATKSSASDETQSIGGVSGKSYFSSSAYVKATDTKAASRAQRYFVLRKVCFKSFRERNGLWQAPKESLHALAPAWFYGNIADIGRHMGTVEDALFKELLTAHACHSPCFIGYMTTNVQALVERSLRTLLHVVGTARLLNEQSKRHVEGADEKTTTFEVLNEAMYRGLWDELFRGLAESSGSADVRYRREAKLRYAEYPSRDLEGHRKEVTRLYEGIYPLGDADSAERARFNWFNNVTQYPEQTDLTAARQEPRSGTADGILYLKVEDIFLDKDVANAVAIWAPTFATGQVEYDEPADAWIQTDEPPQTQFGGSVFASCSRPLFSDQDRAEYRRSTAKRPKPYTDPSPTPAPAGVQPSTTDVPSAPITVRPPAPPKSKESKKAECDGYFPLCANEFKRLLRKWTAGAATNQERLYLVAICTFMRLFNIGRFPVFGLVTSGLTGVLSSAWNQAVKAKDMTHQTICIEDHEATEVHLQNPLDALNVATWIAYIIVEHAPRLRSLFEAATIEDVECAYLLDASGPTPRAKARSMTMQDSHWHKPQSDTQADARYGTSTAKKGRKKANLNAESSRLTSIGE